MQYFIVLYTFKYFLDLSIMTNIKKCWSCDVLQHMHCSLHVIITVDIFCVK